MGQPESLGIRELRQNASRYVDLADQGQRVPVTKRGKLVAYLVPAQEPRSMFERLVAAGEVEPSQPEVDVVLRAVEVVGVGVAVIENASRLPGPLLGSLDAIHLATALLIRHDVEAILTYDDRLGNAAATHGLAVLSPA